MMTPFVSLANRARLISALTLGVFIVFLTSCTVSPITPVASLGEPDSPKSVDTVPLSTDVKVTTIPLGVGNYAVSAEHIQHLAEGNGLIFVGGETSQNIVAIDIETLEPIYEIPLTSGASPYRLAYHPSGLLVAGGTKFVTVFGMDAERVQNYPADDMNLWSNEVVPEVAPDVVPQVTYCVFDCSKEPEKTDITALLFANNGTELIIGGVDNTEGGLSFVSSIDIVENGYLRNVDGGSISPFNLQPVANDPTLAQRMNYVSQEIVQSPDGAITLSSDREVAIVDQENSELLILDLDSGEVTQRVVVGVPGATTPFEYAPYIGDTIDVIESPTTGELYASNIRSNEIVVVDPKAGIILDRIKLHGVEGGPYGLEVTPDGRLLLVAMYGYGELVVIDTVERSVAMRIPVGANPMDVVLASNGLVFVSNSGDDTISVIDIEDLSID